MIKILLLSATELEIKPTLEFLDQNTFSGLKIDICIGGVGMVNTAFELGKRSHVAYALAIQAGIAGSFGGRSIGSVVNVIGDCFSELGAEDDGAFLSIDDMNFGTQKVMIHQPFKSQLINSLPEVFGITVNTVHGRNKSIQQITQRLQPEIESMEGAAFIYAANQSNWQALQLRAISNMVEKRNKDNWNIPLAIKNLNTTLVQLVKSLDAN